MPNHISSGPLDGVRVLDVTQVMAGAYCSLLLADMGADVVKVERPDRGDDTRGMGTNRDIEASPAFNAMNRNKRGVALDLKSARGVEIMRHLVLSADVLVENFRPGTLDRLGLGYQELHALRPELVYCSISGFGSTGPYAAHGGFDLVAQAMSGLVSVTGHPGTDPVKLGVPVCDLNAGLFGAYGVLSAYIHRLRTGEGQLVDTSLLEAGIAYTVWETAALFSTGEVAGPIGSAHRLSAPYEIFPTADGWIALGAANARNWERLCAVLEAPEFADDDRFADNGSRMANRPQLVDELSRRFRTRRRDDWLERLRAAGVPSGPVNDMAEVYADPHVRARRMVGSTDHPVLGEVRHIGPPVKLSATPARVERPAPLLGQHTREVLLEAAVAPSEIDDLLADGVVRETLDARSRAGVTGVTS
ncbi:CoA transferase [Pseudonocardia nematodicida]|uniref:CoA transferase n=1 Tax=Pseudonocardia nematodicida TaxID=1206997 RepID=A0ABV1KK71_9PSEU